MIKECSIKWCKILVLPDAGKTCFRCKQKSKEQYKARGPYGGRTEEQINNIKERNRNYKRKNTRSNLRTSARVRAIEKGIEFDIKSYRDIPKVPEFCPILNIPLFVGNGTSSDNSPSLDRIDNNKGYIKGNLQIISMKANQMKNSATLDDIKKLYDYMIKLSD